MIKMLNKHSKKSLICPIIMLITILCMSFLFTFNKAYATEYVCENLCDIDYNGSSNSHRYDFNVQTEAIRYYDSHKAYSVNNSKFFMNFDCDTGGKKYEYDITFTLIKSGSGFKKSVSYVHLCYNNGGIFNDTIFQTNSEWQIGEYTLKIEGTIHRKGLGGSTENINIVQIVYLA